MRALYSVILVLELIPISYGLGYGFCWAMDSIVSSMFTRPEIICIANTRGPGMDCIARK
jgi:hypothetical protein